MEAIKPLSARRAQDDDNSLHYAEPVAAAPAAAPGAPMALVPLAGAAAQPGGAAPASAAVGPPGPAVPSRPGARQLSLVQMLRQAQDQLRSMVAESPPIAAEIEGEADPLDVIASGEGDAGSVRSQRAHPDAVGAEDGQHNAPEQGSHREPGERHLIIGHGDRTHYLAMAALTLGTATAAPAPVPRLEWHDLELAPVSRAECEQRCRRRGTCDPLDPCGCGGVFCDQQRDDIG